MLWRVDAVVLYPGGVSPHTKNQEFSTPLSRGPRCGRGCGLGPGSKCRLSRKSIPFRMTSRGCYRAGLSLEDETGEGRPFYAALNSLGKGCVNNGEWAGLALL